MDYKTAFDTTNYVRQSLSEVVKTLVESVLLVVLVILIFLQDWRTTLIPTLTIPLSLIGTFAFVKVFDFSINSLTLFGLTLATGMVVDDAIIVVEQISRFIQEKGMNPQQAAIAAMSELSSAVIATSLVLMAVFIPVAFFPGTTGALYQQFALTIAFSIAISTFLALTLTPSLCALLLRQGQHAPPWIAWFFDGFNYFFDGTRQRYRAILGWLSHFKIFVIGLFIALLVVTGLLYTQVPTAFLPDEDRAILLPLSKLPKGFLCNIRAKSSIKLKKKF